MNIYKNDYQVLSPNVTDYSDQLIKSPTIKWPSLSLHEL